LKKLFTLIVILLACIAAGCLTSDSGDDTKDEVSGDTYTITGKVVDGSGAGISGVSITLTGVTAEKAAGENVNLTVSTTSNGSYTFQNIKNGTYVVTASKSGLEIEPSNRTVQVSGSSATVPDFTGSADTGGDGGDGNVYTVSGRIVDSSGNGISGVEVDMIGNNNSYTDLTGSGGNYSFEEVPNGSYSIVPEKSGYTFSPLHNTVIVSGTDIPVGAFTGSTDSDGGDGGDGGTGSGDAGSHTFFPLKKGATWTYHVRDTDVESDETDEYDYTSSISGTEVIDGKEYWVMVDEDDEFDGYFRIEDGVLYVSGGNDVYAKIPKMLAKVVGAGKAIEDVNPFGSEIPLIDLNAGIGQTFVIMDYSESESGMTMTMKMTGKYVGNANIQTAAGSFNNCRQYELVTEYSMTSEFYSTSSTSTSETYLAPNVGFIKSTDKEYEAGELMWLSDEELTSYYIP